MKNTGDGEGIFPFPIKTSLGYDSSSLMIVLFLKTNNNMENVLEKRPSLLRATLILEKESEKKRLSGGMPSFPPSISLSELENYVKEKKTPFNSSFMEKIGRFLLSYFNGKNKPTPKIHKVLLHTLSFPFHTSFSHNVLLEVCKIPFGETRTYKQIAMKLGSKAYRAVGSILARNPFPIFIPCHRVVGSSGKGGFMGKKEKNSPEIKIKTLLLDFEKNFEKRDGLF